MKFTEMAWHPIDDRPLNLIEQLNQTWTYLVTLKALPFLFERHPAAGGFRLNLGTASGTDIESVVAWRRRGRGVRRRASQEQPEAGKRPKKARARLPECAISIRVLRRAGISA